MTIDSLNQVNQALMAENVNTKQQLGEVTGQKHALESQTAEQQALSAKGVKFQVYDGFGQDDLGIWNDPSGRVKLAWFLDADGNNLSLAQH